MEVRPYVPADRDSCLALFDSNTPGPFHPQEREVFETWLSGNPTNYVVLEHEGVVVACGGYALPAAGSTDARLTWGMVGRQWQGQGLGRFLLMYRLRELGKTAAIVQTVTVETTPESAPFFASQGFRTVHVTKDGPGPGLDKTEMVRKISVCP
ncbi:MAG: GNAT family N-acetyltransferase [Bryobacteraceae bacterium]|nr:GNAT family N-acetyltransferase [Bryobacteraceae bacterium]